LGNLPDQTRSACRILLALLAVFGITAGSELNGQPVPSQPQDGDTLSRSLKAEAVELLAADARADGNPVSGAILFSQQKTSCIKCHASGQQNLLGPDLTQLDGQATDVYLVESILNPSRVIRQGFESVSVLMLDGRIFNGRIVSQDSDAIVLRDAGESGQLATLARSEIDEVAPNKLSTMADRLVDELSNRQQFLDLASYMMALADAGPAPASAQLQPDSPHEVLTDELRGLILVDELNCVACHGNQPDPFPFPHKQAPNLIWASGRIDPVYIEKFIASPSHVKPGTGMPDVMHGLDPATRSSAARAITQYLVSSGATEFSRQEIDSTAAIRGRELFHSVGCVACHSPRDEDGHMLHADPTISRNLAAKYNVDGLAAFLEDPLACRPSGRMPNMVLSHWESLDIAHYLLSGKNDSEQESEPFQFDRSLVAEGSSQFQQLGCVTCHGIASGIARESVANVTLPSLANLRTDQGCLSGTPGNWPRYQLDNDRRDMIRAALGRMSKELDKPEQIVLTLQAFNCLACHQRGSLGGVPSEQVHFFKTNNENIGPQGRLPPTLTGVGAKLKSKWMREVLAAGRTIRPYLQTRMPQYGTENVAHLVSLFEEVDTPPEIRFPTFDDPEEMKKTGRQMAGNGGLNCVACHTFQQIPGETMPAVDLTEMTERLHPEWFFTYMRDPQRHSPNTVMPSFWPGGHAMRKDFLDGNANLQIEALWQYLLDDRQARTPQGLINEPIELLATGEAVMLRRSYPGIGKRGIGVGYPGQVNLAFDAEQMRLGMIWKGKFADPAGVWKGQGNGNVHPLGTDVIRFDGGPDLDDATIPWIVDLPEEIAKLEQPNAQAVRIRSPNHQFQGYVLDDLRRPTFLYRFDNVDVRDYSIDVVEEPSGTTIIRRTLTFTSDRGRSGVTFRAATGEAIVAGADGSFLVGKELRVVVVGELKPEVRDAPWGKQLLLPMDIPPGKSTLELEYRW